MKMKNTMTSNHCNNIDPLSTAVSTESTITSGLSKNNGKKKKKGFFSKVKAIFSKSSTEAQKKVSEPFHNAVKNTYVVRETHGPRSNNLQIYGQLNDETNPEKSKICYGIDVNHKGNQRINSILVNDDNLIHSTNENSVSQSAKNNTSWITTSTNTSQGIETNFREIFTEQTLLPGPVDVGIQTKIRSCYKVYLLHKHVSNCDRRNKSNSKIKKNILLNHQDKRQSGNKNYYYYKYSSTTSIYTDESQSGDITKGKLNRKHWRENNAKNHGSFFNKNVNHYETNNFDIELLDSTHKLSKHNKIFTTDSNSYIIIDNGDRTTFSGTLISNYNSSCYDSIEKMRYCKTNVNYKNTEIQTNESHRQDETNGEGSQSKSLPSLNLLGKNRSIRGTKCNSSPLVSQNTTQTRIVKKNELVGTNFIKNSRNNKEIKKAFLRPFRNVHKKNDKNNKETKYEKIQSVNKTMSKSSEEVSNFNSENSSSKRKEKEINNVIKIGTKTGNQKEKNKLNKLKIKHRNSNSTITTDIWQPKMSAIINNDLNTMNIDTNTIKSKENNLFQNDKIRIKHNQTYDQNDHLIYANSDNLKLNRRPIITQPMIFFNQKIKSDKENEVCNCLFNKSFAKKEKKVREVNMKLIEKQQLIKCHSNLKIPLEHQYSNPYKLNFKHPIMSNNRKHMETTTNKEPKRKVKNHKNKEIAISTSPPLAMNKQKFANYIKKNINSSLNRETHSYVPVKEKYNKRSNVIVSKKKDPNCISQFRTPVKTLKKGPKNNYTPWKLSSEILKSSNLTETSFEYNLKKSQSHKNKQVNKETQKNWNEKYSCNNKSNLEKKFNKDPKNLNQEIRMFHDIQIEKLFPKKFSSNVGVHGAFSGNITSKRKTFFAKITPMQTNK